MLIEGSTQTILQPAPLRKSRYSVSIAHDQTAVEAAQRLRYSVFALEMGAQLPAALDGRDIDSLDDLCDHILVRDHETDRIVGCYRILHPADAKRCGYYSASEFDLSALAPVLDKTAEAGRACVHPDYRSGSVVMMLWSGIARYLREHNLQYVMGCASVPINDGGHNAAALAGEVLRHSQSPEPLRVKPHCAFDWRGVAPAIKPIAPPLLKGYLRLGAWVCGDPALDAQFGTADFLTLIDRERIGEQYAKHFLTKMGHATNTPVSLPLARKQA
jgi:putative hemolysin